MGYSTLRHMRDINTAAYGIPYPGDPRDLRDKKSMSNLERGCLTFLRDMCEDLRFDPAKADLSDRDGDSIKPKMIPYNMEMDIDRLCLENAVHRFLSSGTAQDAFDLYFCFLEMYLGDYAKAKKMIEMLAEFESNASALLMKHRDHYSHSAYVFILGCAIYASSDAYRADYRAFSGLEDDRAAAHCFLRQWGFASLFHDIGYPFELPFEQVKSYFGDTIDGVPFVSYRGMARYLAISEAEKAHYEALLGEPLPLDKSGDGFPAADLNSVLAVRIAQTIGGISAEEALRILQRKPGRPDSFSGFMDHAYFSAVILLRQLRDMLGETGIGAGELDIIVSILLHNSIYKRTLQSRPYSLPPLSAGKHPLAYLLMLCDELQCWDRFSYGRESRGQIHPMWCDVEFDGETLCVCYDYDQRMEERVRRAEQQAARDVSEAPKCPVQGTYPKMVSESGKALSFREPGAKPKFVTDIEELIVINQPGALSLEISARFTKNTRVTRTFLSSSSFLHLYNFAVALNARYQTGDIDALTEAQMEADFDRLSLEYKISNIQQAKAFSRYLEAIGCFYTDKPVTYELLDAFSEANMDVIGPMEHERWLREKQSMGWTLDDAYDAQPDSKRLRELTRTHKLMIDDYNELDKAEQDKDTAPMNCMLRLIEKYDGLRIYRI